MLQQLVVTSLVLIAALYVFWSLSGTSLRISALRLLGRIVPPLWAPLGRIQRRLEAPTGCSVCRSSKQ